MRIFLIGFMGSGKSLLGKQLAEKLKFQFIDLDKYIEEKGKKNIEEIFQKNGEDYFRKIESKYLVETIHFENTVIACGGGTPCFYKNMNWLNKNGTTVYLKLSTEILHERLLPIKNNRPLLAHLKDEELMDFIEGKLKEREKFYLKSKFVIENPTTDILYSLPFGKS